MTSRLKRKLGDLGVDTSSRKANENFCLIGTPLPPLEKSKDTGEFVPLWKQEVRDEKGRRRLHGAFTGGWSAGYFNTVGSKEGWAPSTFVSSRTDRVKKQSARPEDFMDDEDLQDRKDNLKLVDTTEEMDLIGGTQAELRSKSNDDETGADPIPLALQTTLLPPPKSSIGAQILQRMGWRAGQGIGPRVSLARRRAQDAQAYDPFTGTRLESGSLDIPEEDEEAQKHLYAPRDAPVLSVQRKDNAHGLGYVPGTTLHSTLGASSSSASGPRLAGGFGLGALNDADEDDLDVYDGVRHPSSSRRRVAYDHVEGADDDDMVLIGSSNARGHAFAGKRKGASSLHTTTPSSYLRDGRPILQGFILSDEPVAQDKWFPLPDIPPGWKPNPRSLWAANKENTKATPPATAQLAQGEPQSHAKWRSSRLSADQRGSLLGEAPLAPEPAKSVFEYMSEKDRERIQRIASNLASGKASTTPGTLPSFSITSATPATIPEAPAPAMIHLDAHVAQAALQGFQPFTADPVKQARYTSFLQSFASGSTTASLQPLPDQKNEEFTKELSDFSKAAALFKPMSGAMQGRFMSASVLDMGPQIIEGLHHPSQAESGGDDGRAREQAEREKEAAEQVDPKVNAAKMGMYGPLTREARPWVPARLLCKRFGVREPEASVESVTEVPKPGQSSELTFAPSSSSSSVMASANADGMRSGAGGGPRDITNLGLGEDEMQGRDILTYQRPPVDVFKAIFASDDEDEDHEDEDAEVGEAVDEGKVGGREGGFTSAKVLDDNDEPVDLETFKPRFIPRKKNEGKEKEDNGERKERKEKKRKARVKDKKVLVSFELDETGGEGESRDPKRSKADRASKKRRKERGSGDGDGDAIKVDVDMRAPEHEVKETVVSTNPGEVNRSRKRAVDFMD